MSNDNHTTKSPFGWKGVAVAFILGGIFMLFFYLAVNDRPDYMQKKPSEQPTQHDMSKPMTQTENDTNHSEQHQNTHQQH